MDICQRGRQAFIALDSKPLKEWNSSNTPAFGGAGMRADVAGEMTLCLQEPPPSEPLMRVFAEKCRWEGPQGLTMNLGGKEIHALAEAAGQDEIFVPMTPELLDALRAEIEMVCQSSGAGE